MTRRLCAAKDCLLTAVECERDVLEVEQAPRFAKLHYAEDRQAVERHYDDGEKK
jgi:hypothetical protein